MNLSRLITGSILIIFGIIMFSPIFFTKNFYVSIIIGSILIIFGLIIFFNSKEDKIEGIKKGKEMRASSKSARRKKSR